MIIYIIIIYFCSLNKKTAHISLDGLVKGGQVNLLDQNPTVLIPYAVLMLVMLHAMMEFTVSLLAKPSPTKRKPVPADELRKRLLALETSEQAFQLRQGQDCDLEIYWEYVMDRQPVGLAIQRGSSMNRIRLLLDEVRHEIRMNEASRSAYFFLGMVGWLPRLRGHFSAQAGPPGEGMTGHIRQVAHHAGWGVRPVIWWFEATYQGHRFLETLTPSFLRKWPARRLWGILYPLSFILGMGYLVAILRPLDGRNLFILLGVSAAWWGVWGFLTWMLLGFPRFWRR